MRHGALESQRRGHLNWHIRVIMSVVSLSAILIAPSGATDFQTVHCKPPLSSRITLASDFSRVTTDLMIRLSRTYLYNGVHLRGIRLSFLNPAILFYLEFTIR